MLPWVSSWRVGARQARRQPARARARADARTARRAPRGAHGSAHRLDHRPHLLAAAAAGAGHRHEAVRDGLRQHVLDVVGRDVVAAAEQRAGARRAQHGDAGARRQALDEPARPSAWPRSAPAGSRAARPTRAPTARPPAPRSARPASSRGASRPIASRRSPPASSSRSLFAIGIAERDAHQEAVELRLGQRIGAELVGRVLRRDDEEGRGQGARLAFDA